MIKVLAIDLDDTFYMTEEVAYHLENQALDDIGIEKFSREMHIKTWGEPLFSAIKKRSPGIDVVAFEESFRNRLKEFIFEGKIDQLSKDNCSALDKLIELGYRIAVLTSRSKSEVEHLLRDNHHLGSRIGNFYHMDNNPFHKPDPKSFDLLLRDFRAEPHECVYVGDSLGDAKASKSAGLYFFASLESGLRNKIDFENLNCEPDGYLEKFSDIVDALENLNNFLKLT